MTTWQERFGEVPEGEVFNFTMEGTIANVNINKPEDMQWHTFFELINSMVLYGISQEMDCSIEEVVNLLRIERAIANGVEIEEFDEDNIPQD